ncbi:MAG: ABC transporter permease [Acidobacteriota bacterium]
MTRIYAIETKFEFMKMLRMKTYSVSTIMFPLMFYCFFGLAMGRQPEHGSDLSMAKYLLATYGAFAVIGAMLYSFGVGMAVERGLGWLEVKRASPMPQAAYLVAKAVVALAFGAIVVALLFTLGAVFGEVQMPLGQWFALAGTLLLGALPFCAMGMAIGSFAGPNSAPAIVNLIYMPMAFCAGLWVPIQFLPGVLKSIAPLLPTYHFGQLALSVMNAPTTGTSLRHIEALAAFTILFAGIAWLGNSREREKMYG